MKFRSVKEALGNYAANRKGKGLVSCVPRQRVQEGTLPRLAWLHVGACIFSPEPVGLGLSREDGERLVEWASLADTPGIDPGAVVGRLADKLRALGLLRVDEPPPVCERGDFVDLNTGKVITTTRSV